MEPDSGKVRAVATEGIVKHENPVVGSTDEARETRAADTSRNKATVRILDILNNFASQQRSFGVTELSKKLGISKNIAYRALSTLLKEGFVVHDASGERYQLGFRVVELLNENIPLPDFRSLAEPYVFDLHEASGQTVHVCSRIGDFVAIIDGIEGTGPVLVRTRVGRQIPLHASPASRAILASLTDAQIEDYIARNAPLERFTSTTLSIRKQIFEDVGRVRQTGYALGLRDWNPGSNAVSFPILDRLGRPHGSINVGGPVSRFPIERLSALLPRLQEIIAGLQSKAELYYAEE